MQAYASRTTTNQALVNLQPSAPCKSSASRGWKGLVAALMMSGGLLAGAAAAQNTHDMITPDQKGDQIQLALEAAERGDLTQVELLLETASVASAERALLEAQWAAAMLDEHRAQTALGRYFASDTNDALHRQSARRIAARTAFVAGRYGDAAAYARAYLDADEARSAPPNEGMTHLSLICGRLSGEPRQIVLDRGPGVAVPTMRDKVGLIRTRVTTSSGSEDAIIDTGANLSVARASVAKSLGLRIIEGDAAVGNSLGAAVAVKLGIAEEFAIAGARLANVVFLIMDDEALSFSTPDGPYQIGLIVGLPVLKALGSLELGPGDSLRLVNPAREAGSESNLRFVASDPFVLASVGGHHHPFFLDTGANRSAVFPRYLAEHPDMNTGAATEARRSGAGGTRLVEEATRADVTLKIGDRETVLPSLRVKKAAGPRDDEDRYGVLGVDAIDALGALTIDFVNMRVEVSE